MPTIDKIELTEIHLPLTERIVTATGSYALRRILLIQMFDSDGASAWGECVAGEYPHYTSETIDTAWLALTTWLAPDVLGRKYESASDIQTELEGKVRGHYMAKSALEMTFWGLLAARARLPLAALLGGTRQRILTGIAVGIQDSSEKLVDRVRRHLEEGYRRIKVKIGPGRDVDAIRLLRESLGSDAPLAVDANNSYNISDLHILSELDGFNLMMIEQPLAWDDLVRHAEIQKRLRTPICLDESIRHIRDAEDMVVLGSGRIINLKPGRVGGLTSAVAIHDFCSENDIDVWCGGMFESGIGRAYNVALASLPGFSLPGDLSPSRRYWGQDIVHPEWTMSSSGKVTVPAAPGIGVEVDTDRIGHLTVRHEVLKR